jgi:hypothetical protein
MNIQRRHCLETNAPFLRIGVIRAHGLEYYKKEEKKEDVPEMSGLKKGVKD